MLTKLGEQHERVSETGPATSRFQTVLVLLLAVATGIVFIDRLGITFVFADMKAEMGLRNAQLGSLMAITSFAWAAASIFFSYLSDRMGGRGKLLIISCMIVFSLMTGFTGLMKTFAGMLAVRFLIGVFEGPMIPLIQSTVVRISSPRRLGTNLAIVIAGGGLLGAALPPLVLGTLAASLGWRHSFVLLAIPGLGLALLLAFILPRDRSARTAETAKPTIAEAIALFRIRNVWLGAIGAITLIGWAITVASFLPLYLHDAVGLSNSTRMAALAAFGLTGGIGGIVAPALSDFFSRKACLLLATGAAVISSVFLVLSAGNPVLLYPALIFWFIAGGGLTIMVYIIPGESVPGRLTATTYAALLAVGEIAGGATAPAIGGVLADRYGLPATLWFTVVVATAAVTVALAMREPPRRQASDATPK